jgi:hypothetical protein
MMMRFGVLAGALLELTVVSNIDAQDRAILDVSGGRIELSFASAPTPEFRKLVLDWVNTSARAVANYYQQFPVKQVGIRINTFDGHGIGSGKTFDWNGARIRISVGTASTSADFAEDWMLTHEMVHLAFPSVTENHHWIEEGQATYIEPVARARIGNLKVARVWADWIEDMPKGLPDTGDRGLDFTPTWGRTYWGGALFCLLADIEIHKRTQNRKGLEHALRAILKAGGNIESDWDLERALETGDGATGVPVLRELYDKMKTSPEVMDLDALWKQLGVKREGDRIEFNDNAPLATIRRAITNNTP